MGSIDGKEKLFLSFGGHMNKVITEQSLLPSFGACFIVILMNHQDELISEKNNHWMLRYLFLAKISILNILFKTKLIEWCFLIFYSLVIFVV